MKTHKASLVILCGFLQQLFRQAVLIVQLFRRLNNRRTGCPERERS